MDTTTDQLLRHADFVRRLCRGLLSDADAADDVAQDTLAAALERPHIRAPRAWLAAVARRMAARHLRGEARRARRETAAARHGTAPPADEIAAQAEMQRRLAEGVRALDEPYRTVVILRYFHDLTPKEIARRLGAPYETVHSRLRRAHALLRRRLDETHGHRTWLPLAAAMAWPRRTVAAAVGAGFAAAAVALSLTLLALGGGDRDGIAPRAGSAHEPARVDGGGAGVAPGTEAAVAEAPTDLVRATGRVTTLWGRGVPGARVAVMPWLSSLDYWERNPVPPAPLAETTTGADGSFSIDAPLGTGWALLAHAPGHAWSGHELALGIRRDFLTIRLPPGERLTGIVVDEAGAPVALARVRAVAGSAEIPGAFVRTGPDGRFAFEDGALYVHVDHDSLAVLDAGVNCAPDQWRVVLGPGETVSGEVLAADGAPVPGARIRIAPWPGSWGLSGSADAAGRFVIDRVPLRDGDRLTVVVDGGARGSVELTSAFTPGLHLALRLPASPPRGAVLGRVIEMKGQEIVGPVPDVVVREIAFGGFAPLPEAVTDAEGRFKLTSARVDARDRIEVVDSRFFMDWKPQVPDLATDEVGIVVRRVGSVAGRVVDDAGRPVPGAAVAVYPDEPQLWITLEETSPHTCVSDEQGAFRVPSTAGARRVWASKQGYLRSASEPFSIADAGERTGIVVTLQAGAALSGRVSDRAGLPIAGALVGALVGADGRQTHTNEEGAFTLGGLKGGKAKVWIACRGYQGRFMEMEVPASEPLAVALEPSLTFRGRLRTAEGEPLPFALLGRGIPADHRSPSGGQGDGWTRSLEDASFAFRDLATGRFSLVLRERGWELVGPEILYDSTNASVVDVLVRRKSALVISGRVLDGAGQPFPLGEAPHVTAMPEGSDDPNRWRSNECRQDGSFTIENVEDVEHVLSIRAATAVFEERHVKAGTSDIRIVPSRPRKLTGRVLGADGQPLAGVEVRALPPGKGPLPVRNPNSRKELRWPLHHDVYWTDPEGGFRFDRLVGERVTIWAFHREHQPVVETIATNQEGIELRLPKGLTLSGVLLDAERRPLAEHQLIVASADRAVRNTKTDANGAFTLLGLSEGECDVSVTDKGGRLVLEATLPAATEGTELQVPAR